MKRLVRKFHKRLIGEEAERICRMTILINLLAVVMCTFFAITSKMNGNPLHAAILFLTTGLVVINILAFIKLGRMTPFILNTCFLFLVFCGYLQISGGVEKTGILWHYVYPIMVFYVAGIHMGSICSATLILMEVFLFAFDDLFSFQAQYAPLFKSRFIATMVTMSLIGAMLEYSRFKNQGRLRRLAEKFQEASQKDGLTGLANRRAIDDKLADEVTRSERTKKDFSVLLCDIDFFKRINDQHGHAIGDMALKHFARCLEKNLRGYDIPSRWGGEEFLVLLPETDLPKAASLAERIRLMVEKSPFLAENGKTIKMTISIGVGSWGECRDINDLVLKVDTRLYAAKHGGRNRVVWE